MNSDFSGPVNIGSEEMVSINQLAQLVIDISGKNLSIKNIPGPEGVRGRNSDNTLIREKLGWDYQQSLKQGIEITYNWIFKQVSENRYKENDLKILLKIGSVKK
jgi:nucleoside-diphosphate-sugar epimerase